MDTHTGWLIDLYPDEHGLALWLLADAGPRLPLRIDFPLTFYAGGPPQRLRAAWRFLRPFQLALARQTRRDLFSGQLDLLAVTLPHPAALPPLLAEFIAQFPDLDLYDADIPLALRFAARHGLGLLGRCQLDCLANRVERVTALDDPWQLEPQPLPLRILELTPDADPLQRPPRQVRVRYARADYLLDLQPHRAFEAALSALLRQFDPDLILTEHGDAWLLPALTINPNRDPAREILLRNANSYFAYGQVVFRGAQAHLFGRWHIDRCNAMLFHEYGLEGVLEQARVTGLGVQDMARKSPGAGITAMQMLTALRLDVLVPFVKQQAETSRSLDDLIRADKGGMIYQPLTGLHASVAQIDFASMYPSIMVNFNISPETNGRPGAPDGLIPQTLRPLLQKRLALKRLLTSLHPRDCRAAVLKARAAALKWLLVVCFGYLGYKNARFGKIESHEAVTSISRELLLQAKETAEDMGFLVLHMYVDCLFVQKPGCHTAADFTPLLDAIAAQTGIPIALDGVYRWVAFLPSRRDARIPVPNRYFGVFQDGELKYRGIELRRHDTPLWVSKLQLAVLNCLAAAPTLAEARQRVPQARALLARALRDLRAGQVPLDDLLVSLRLSRAVQDYRAPSPAARAASQLIALGQQLAPGQTIRFVYTRGRPGVWAYGSGEFDPRTLDLDRYRQLLERAVASVLAVFSDPSGDPLPIPGLLAPPPHS
jgi:DNA polymerase-2